MAKVQMYLAPADVMRCMYDFGGKEKASLAQREFSRYTPVPEFEFDCTDPLEACDEAFDLTNNPSRQEEREEKYGRGRSLSVGDVVSVDGVQYVCLSIGWAKL